MLSRVTPAQLTSAFIAAFGPGPAPVLVRSPGRVNLIGEHTDYNDGFVFPMAIGPHVLLAGRARDDGRVAVCSTLFEGEAAEFAINGVITPGAPSWANYVRGPVAVLKAKGVPLVGMDCLITNTLPPGGGLSSSAAMEVGTGRLMMALAGEDMDALTLALLCQKAEQDYAGVPCGVMDQTIVSAGKAGHAMLLDCRSHTPEFFPLSEDVAVVVVNSMVKHALTGGEYAERRRQCEAGTAYFARRDPKVKALRDVTPGQVEDARADLDDVIFRRCRHVTTENARCLRFAEDLQAADYAAAGRLMLASHASLRDDYEVSVPELDELVEIARALPGVYGSRMTGGGFGGCTVSLVRPDAVAGFLGQIRAKYKAARGIDAVAFATEAADGAAVVAG